MEESDKDILRNLLAQRVGKVVGQTVLKMDGLDVDVHVEALVSTPSCYMDDKGEMHTGKLVSVVVIFSEEGEEDDED